jgi:hypothetical protein
MAFLAIVLTLVMAQGPAQSVAAPSLVLRCGEEPGEVTLSIHNPDQTDTAILLGVSLANGRWYLPRELVVELTRNGNPEIEELVFRGPSGIAGRMDHWVVPLPTRSTFILTLRPSDFISTSAARAVSAPEELKIRLTGRSINSDLSLDMTGMKTWRVWTGTVVSNPLRISDCSQ